MTSDDEPVLDDPVELATVVGSRRRPLLVGLDVDGVLAPIVEHADDATLLPGVLDAVVALSARTPVAVVSGRRLEDLLAFGFTPPIDVFGTHGLERHGADELELAPHERHRHDRLRAIAEEAAALAGDGAWVEIKRAGVVLHVREVAPEPAALATAAALRAAEDVTDAHVKSGKAVVELLARATSKATAVQTRRDETAAATVVFVGDDRTDEEVFLAMAPGDIGIRVGDGPTAAHHRLADPAAVLSFLTALVRTLSDPV
jgi:trehalose 6-phosphate phosphatase